MDKDETRSELIQKLEEIKGKNRGKEYEEGFDDCLEIICNIFGLERE